VTVRLPDDVEVATLTPASGIPATATVSAATVEDAPADVPEIVRVAPALPVVLLVPVDVPATGV